LSKNFNVKSTFGNYSVCYDTFNNIKNEIISNDPFFIIDKRLKKIYNHLFSEISDERILFIDSDENAKSFERCSSYLEDLLSRKIKKNSTLIAIGGGVIQDITGFMSSIIFRGIDWIFIPTTLLAQCDSCIGSKTSINFQSYKNVLGNFYPPKKVIIDSSFLSTLPFEDIKSGIGEMTHYFFFSNSNFLKPMYDKYEKLLERSDDITPFIDESLKIKKSVIEIDEFDQGIRNKFQFGHTFGHAIENATKYKINHGQAVTIGMDIAMFLSVEKKIMKESDYKFYNKMISKNFPYLPKDFDFESFYKALKRDKKNIENFLVCILICKPGELVKTQIAIDNQLKKTLKKYFKQF